LKPLRLMVPALVLLSVFAAVLIGAPRAYRWYQDLRHPISPKVPVGSTSWTPPAGSVAMAASNGPAGATDGESMSRQEADGKLKNPLPSSPEVIERGKQHFLTYCAHCHGVAGKGDGPVARHAAFPPPDLTLAAALRSEGFLYATIRNGGVVMPPQGHALSPQERWETVHFLKSIAQTVPAPDKISEAQPGQPTSPGESTPTQPTAVAKGDAAKGKTVFEAKCSACHDATSDQEIVGPGLKDLFRWPAHQAPDGSQHARHTVPVIRKQIVEGGGAMPPVTGLSEQDLADLLVYLQTL